MSPIVRLENFQQFAAINVLSDPGHVGGPILIPNAIQVVFNWTYAGGRTGHNVLYGTTAGVPAPSVSQADALFTALFGTASFTSVRSGLHTSCTIASLTLRSVHAIEQPVFQSTAASIAGVGAGIPMPTEMAIVITTRTAKTGKSNRGRIYIGGWAEGTGTAGNVLGGTQVTNLQTWANTFITAFSGAGLTLAIGQPARAAYIGTTGTAHPARLATSTPITSLVVRNNTWDSQRRRGLK